MTCIGWKEQFARSVYTIGVCSVVGLLAGGANGQGSGNWNVEAVGDLDGDGNSDIFWRDDTTSLMFYWFMNGVQIINAGSGNLVPPWLSLELSADFNGDGRDDLLWKDTQTGALKIWYMDGTQVASVASIGSFKDPLWQVVAAADVENDGDSDLYLYHTETGGVSLWRFDGPYAATATVISSATSADWELVGVEDVDADGSSDLIWHHTNAATVYVWYMNGAQILGYDSLGTMPGAGWEMVGLGDFIDDAGADLFWQNHQTGFTATQRGTEKATDATMSTVALDDPAFELAGVGDFNGDGIDDVLWQHPSTHETQLWTSGPSIPTGVYSLPDCVECGVPARPRYLLVDLLDFDDIEPGDPLHDELLGMIDDYNIQMTHVFTAGSVDPDNDGFVNLNLFAERIEFLMPEEFDGFAAIDIEDPYFDQIILGPGNPEYEQAVQQLVLALSLAKSMRPNAKWSIYGLPRVRRWFHEPQHLVIAAAPTEIFDLMDWFGPTIYDTYHNHMHPIFRENHIEHLTDLLSLSRQLAEGRPVIPWIWHRRHPGGGDLNLPAYTLIGNSEFIEDQATLAMQMGADGAIWFNSDQYFIFEVMFKDPPYSPGHHLYNLQQYLLETFDAEVPEGIDYDQHLKIIKTIYLPLISDTVNATP